MSNHGPQRNGLAYAPPSDNVRVAIETALQGFVVPEPMPMADHGNRDVVPLPPSQAAAGALPNAGSNNTPQPAAPACSRYGREYKRPRPFTPPTASRPERPNSILALPEAEPDHAQQLDFEDVVDDDSESELQVVDDDMEVADNGAAQPAEPGRAGGVDEDQSMPGGIIAHSRNVDPPLRAGCRLMD